MAKPQAPPPGYDPDLDPPPPDLETAEGMNAYLRACITINPHDISGEFVRLPSDLAFWSEKYNSAAEASMRAKLHREKCAAEVELAVRKVALQSGEKITESVVSARVAVDPDYHEMSMAYVDAEADRNRLRSTVDAILAKKDMLVSLGAHARAEMTANISTRITGAPQQFQDRDQRGRDR